MVTWLCADVVQGQKDSEIAKLREQVQSATANSIAAEQGTATCSARVAALEARNKEVHQIHVRLITCHPVRFNNKGLGH